MNFLHLKQKKASPFRLIILFQNKTKKNYSYFQFHSHSLPRLIWTIFAATVIVCNPEPVHLWHATRCIANQWQLSNVDSGTERLSLCIHNTNNNHLNTTKKKFWIVFACALFISRLLLHLLWKTNFFPRFHFKRKAKTELLKPYEQ